MDTEDIIEAHATVVINNQEASQSEWLAERLTGIGGSDAAPALQLSPYKGRSVLYAEKIGEWFDETDNEPMFWGRQLEGAILDGFAIREEVPIRRFPYMLRSKENPFMTVNLDGITTEDGSVVEVKNVHIRMADEWTDDNGQPCVPDHYGLQGQHACAVTGLSGIHFACLIGGQELRHIYVERDDELIGDLVEHLRAFWQLVEQRTPPSMDGLPNTGKVLSQRYAESILAAKEVDPIVLDWIVQRAQIKAQIKELEEQAESFTNSIKAELGKHELGTVGGETVATWKRQNRKGYVVQPTTYRKIHIPKSKAVAAHTLSIHRASITQGESA